MINNYKRHVISEPVEMVELVKKGVAPWVIDVPIHLELKIKDAVTNYLVYKNDVQWRKINEKNHEHAYLQAYLYLTGRYGYQKDTQYDIYFNEKRIKKYPSFCFLLAVQYSLIESKQTWQVTRIYDFLEKGVKLKDPESLYTVGRMYMEGMKYKKDINKGIKLLSLACEQNHPGALFLLSNYYSNGMLVKQNVKKANKLMEKANQIGIGNDFYSKHPDIVPFWDYIVNADSENLLFDSIINKANKLTPFKIVKYTKLSDIVNYYDTNPLNVSVIIPTEHRERLFKELKQKVDSFRKNDYPAECEKYLLAYVQFLYSGYGCKKDDNEIFKTIMDLEFIGSVKGYNIKGICYELGIGVEKNILLAKEWYLKAIEVSPTSNALINLARMHRNKNYEIYDEKVSFEYALKALENGNNKALFEIAYDYLFGINVVANDYKAARLYEFGEKLNYLDLLKSLGYSFYYGRGIISQSNTSAIKIFKKCEELFDDVESTYYLGLLYKANMQYDLAFKCFKKCENKNYKKVNLELAIAYDLGQGVTKNQAIALEYYNKVEEGQNAGAVFNNLGVMYKKGEVVEKDLEKAFYYYKKAYEFKINKAYKNLAYCYFEGQGVEVDYKKGLEILEEGIKEDKSDAYIYYGYIYEKGIYGVKQDHKKAFEYYTKAVELKNAEGYYHLAWCYKDGIGCYQSDYMFMQNLEYAKRNGYKDINYGYGCAYYSGIGTSKDFKQAEKYFRKSIENKEGHDGFCYGALGYIYEVGYKKSIEAFSYYKKAADLGDAYGHLALGNCYYNGVGCQRNKNLAKEYWQKAADLGDVRGKTNLINYK